jgi:hypothetical protein
MRDEVPRSARERSSALPDRLAEIDLRRRRHGARDSPCAGADRRARQRRTDHRADHRPARRADSGAGKAAIANRLAAARERQRRDDKREREAKAFIHPGCPPFALAKPTDVSSARTVLGNCVGILVGPPVPQWTIRPVFLLILPSLRI